MAESRLGQLVGNAVGGILLFALLGSLGSCAFTAIGQSVNHARHAELAAQRRAAEAAAITASRREDRARVAAAESRKAEHEEKMGEYAERARDNENRCIREMDYETCRRIYRPTAAERAREQAVVERAARIAEAYRDE